MTLRSELLNMQRSKVFEIKTTRKRKSFSAMDRFKMIKTPVTISPYKWIVKTKKKFLCNRCGRTVFLLFHKCTKSETSATGFIDMSDKSKKKRSDSWKSSVYENYNRYRNVAKIYRFSDMEPKENLDYFYRGFFWYQRVFPSDEQLKMLDVLKTVSKKKKQINK